jgi:hypothetical protein
MPAWLQGNVTFAASAIRERADVPIAWCATAHGGGGRRPSSAGGPVQHERRLGARRILGCMSRMIWRVLGAILAVWLAFTAIGRIFAMLKIFAVIGLIAVVVFIIVWLIAGRARRDNAER